MRLLTDDELNTCNEAELWELYRRMMFYLTALDNGSLDYLNVQMNILRIRQAIARKAHLGPR